MAPVLKLMREASSPDTDHKVLQAATAAIQQYAEETGRDDLVAWGYRNVWFRFEPHEVSTIIPVSLQTISRLQHMFLSAFESRRDAEFPAHEIQGAFLRHEPESSGAAVRYDLDVPRLRMVP